MLDDFREWLSDNLRYILLGLTALLVIIIVVFAVKLIRGSSSGKSQNAQQSSSQTTSSSDSSDGQTSQESGAQQETTVQQQTTAQQENSIQQNSADSDLIKDDAAVLTLVRKHYDAVAASDITVLSEIVTPWNDSVKESILSNNIIESYSDIETYSKAGLTEGSSIVFAYFKGTIAGFEEKIPTLRRLYLVTDNGTLKVSYNCDSDQSVSDYITSVISEDSVQQLIAKVNTEYNEVISSNPDLKTYLDTLDTSSDEQESSETSETESTESSNGAGDIRSALYDLNIRQEPSTSANILGTVPKGYQVTVIEDVDDGWTYMAFDADTGTLEGYVRTEYLQTEVSASQSSDSAGETTVA